MAANGQRSVKGQHTSSNSVSLEQLGTDAALDEPRIAQPRRIIEDRIDWWPMKISALPVLAIAIFSYAVQAANSSKDQKVTGTYEFIICKGACSFSDRGNVFATAVVVFFDGMMTQNRVEMVSSLANSVHGRQAASCGTTAHWNACRLVTSLQ